MSLQIMYLSLQLAVISVIVRLCACWQYFTTLNDLTLTNSKAKDMVQHSQYIFGNCKREDIKFYTSTHLTHMDILGKIIVRGWLEVPRIPTCIRIQARSFEEHTFRSTAFPFQICVPRMTYVHSAQKWQFFYYEWYIPLEYEGGMDYDIYFFGPMRKWW